MMPTLGKKKIIFIAATILSIIVLVVMGIRISQSRLFAKPRTFEPPKIPVVVEPVTKGEIKMTLTYPGDLHAEREATVYGPVNGRVIRYNYREGDEVARGVTIALLDREEKYNRYKPVLVDAPISGRLAEIYLEPGAYATTQTPLCLVIGGDSIRGVMRVPNPELGTIRQGMEATLAVPDIVGKTFSGTVTHVTPFIQSETRTGEVQADFTDDGSSLVPGMYGDVTIVLDKKDGVLTIPVTALLYEQEEPKRPYVFVVVGEKAAKRPVEIGIENQEKIEVLTGLALGDRVVTTGKENLSDTSSVVVVQDR